MTILIAATFGALSGLSMAREGNAHGANAVVGSVGGLVATYLGQDFGWNGPNDGAGPIGAAVGAVFVVALGRAIAGLSLAPARTLRGTKTLVRDSASKPPGSEITSKAR